MIEEIRLNKEEINKAFSGAPDHHQAIANTATDKAIKKIVEFVEDKMAQAPAGCEGYLCMDCTEDWLEALKKLVKEE